MSIHRSSVNIIGNVSGLFWVVNPLIVYPIVNWAHDAVQIAMVGECNGILPLDESFDLMPILPLELLIGYRGVEEG